MPIPTQSKTINNISNAKTEASARKVDVLSVDDGSNAFLSSSPIANLSPYSKGKPSIERLPRHLRSQFYNLNKNVTLRYSVNHDNSIDGLAQKQESLSDIRKKLVFPEEEDASKIPRDPSLCGVRKPNPVLQTVGGEISPASRRRYKSWKSSDDCDASSYKFFPRKLNVDPLRENHGHQADRISVYVRVRPMSNKEKEKGALCCVKVENKTEIYLTETSLDPDCLRLKRLKGRYFVFDGVFPEDTCQEDVYRFSSAHLVEGVLEGRNSSVICYGATGAGKTFTMLGTLSEPGVMVLALRDLFAKLNQRSREGDYAVRLSYMEVYNEAVKDLLSPGGALVLREDARQGIVAAGITEHKAHSADEVMVLLQQGNQHRTTEPTRLNETSSRSHAILLVMVEYHTDGGSIISRMGKLSLIDLAGSERAIATDQRSLRSLEGANINRSLLALSSCISALVEGKKHIPFRNSKLTQLLKDSLGGSSQTAMIANISPSSLSFGETQNTLYWADRAKEIRTKACLAKEVFQTPESENEHLRILLEVQKENELLRMQVDLLKKKLLAFESAAITSIPMTNIPEEMTELVANVPVLQEKLFQEANAVYSDEVMLQEKQIQTDNSVGNAVETLPERSILEEHMIGNARETIQDILIQKECTSADAEDTVQEKPIENENVVGIAAAAALPTRVIEKENIEGICFIEPFQECVLLSQVPDNFSNERTVENTLFKEASTPNVYLYIESPFSVLKEGRHDKFLSVKQLASSYAERQTFIRTPFPSIFPSLDFHKIPRGHFCKKQIFWDNTDRIRPYPRGFHRDTRCFTNASESPCMLFQVSLILFSSHANPFKRLVSCFDYILQKRFTGG